MAKQGQHDHDANDQNVSKGHNNPTKSQTIVTGSYKKQETYKQQAAEHKDPGKQAQAAKNVWREDTRDEPASPDGTRAHQPRSGRSGSESNADSATRGH